MTFFVYMYTNDSSESNGFLNFLIIRDILIPIKQSSLQRGIPETLTYIVLVKHICFQFLISKTHAPQNHKRPKLNAQNNQNSKEIYGKK